MKLKTLLIGLSTALLLSVPAPRGAAAEGKFIEVTVDAPHENRIPLDIAYEKATIFAVESHNDPQEKDIEEAKAKDPNDRTFVGIRFYYRNADYVRHHVKLRSVLLTEDGAVVAEGGRSVGLDPKQTNDTVSFVVRVKTLDWPKAVKMKVTATFVD